MQNYQPGELIRDEDVIRAHNHIYYTQEEVDAFRDKSTQRCPTYGNCNRCWASGPVGDVCQECDSHECGYQVVGVAIKELRTPQVFLDAENIAELLRQITRLPKEIGAYDG